MIGMDILSKDKVFLRQLLQSFKSDRQVHTNVKYTLLLESQKGAK